VSYTQPLSTSIVPIDTWMSCSSVPSPSSVTKPRPVTVTSRRPDSIVELMTGVTCATPRPAFASAEVNIGTPSIARLTRMVSGPVARPAPTKMLCAEMVRESRLPVNVPRNDASPWPSYCVLRSAPGSVQPQPAPCWTDIFGSVVSHVGGTPVCT
jgi:hypothetical protein